MLIRNFNHKFKNKNWRGIHASGSNLIGIDDDFLVKKEYKEEIDDRYWSRVCSLALEAQPTIISDRWVNQYLNVHDNYFYDRESIVVNNSILNLIDNNLSRLSSCAKLLIVIGPVPEIPHYAPNFYVTTEIKRRVNRDWHDLYSSPINSILDDSKVDKNVYVLQPSDFLCDEKICNSVDRNQLSLYYDDDHLSSIGSFGITDEVVKIISSIVY